MSIPSVHQTTNLGPCDHHDDDEQSEKWCRTKTKANSFILLFTAPFKRWKYDDQPNPTYFLPPFPTYFPTYPPLPTGHQRNDLPDTQPLTPSHAQSQYSLMMITIMKVMMLMVIMMTTMMIAFFVFL